MRPGLNYLFIVNLFIYGCANDSAAAGALGAAEKAGFLMSRPGILVHLTHSSLKTIRTDFNLRRERREAICVQGMTQDLSNTKDPRISDSFKPLGEGSVQFNVQRISK